MALNEDNYIALLNKYNKFHDSTEEKKKLGIHDYSLINALLKKTDEVNLHSNFIYSMINPCSSHYCGNVFLELFLESIGKSNFIDTNNARVYKEKGKIDLLIEDGQKVMIIENKLRAVDQEHQISRYVQYVKEKYFKDIDDMSDNICIVYLSEYKSIPSEDKESMIGFILKNDKLVWQNGDKDLCNNTTLTLPEETELYFIRVRHSKQLYSWVKESTNWINNYRIGSSLINAFYEYRLILDRLKNNNWRKIMSLDEYTLGLEEKEQENMYQFMKESARYLNDYKGRKLFKEISRIFKDINQDDIIDIKSFSEENCRKWYREVGNLEKWKNVGFKFEQNSKIFVFILAERWIYFGEYKKDAYFMKENRIIMDSTNPKKATKKFDIYSIIDVMSKRFKEII